MSLRFGSEPDWIVTDSNSVSQLLNEYGIPSGHPNYPYYEKYILDKLQGTWFESPDELRNAILPYILKTAGENAEEAPEFPEAQVTKQELIRLYKQEAKGIYNEELIDEIISKFLETLKKMIEVDRHWISKEEAAGYPESGTTERLKEQVEEEKYLIQILQNAKSPQEKMIAIDHTINIAHETGVYGGYLIEDYDDSFLDELSNLKISSKLNFKTADAETLQENFYEPGKSDEYPKGPKKPRLRFPFHNYPDEQGNIININPNISNPMEYESSPGSPAYGPGICGSLNMRKNSKHNKSMGLWAIYKNEIYTLEDPTERKQHIQWFEEIGLPTYGEEFDKVVRGWYDHINSFYKIVRNINTGTFEEFSDNLPKLLEILHFPPNTVLLEWPGTSKEAKVPPIGLWAIYNGKIYNKLTDVFEYEEHESWFTELGLPTSGAEYDYITRGVYKPDRITWYEGTGTFEEFSNNLPKLKEKLGLPKNVHIDSVPFFPWRETKLSMKKESYDLEPLMQEILGEFNKCDFEITDPVDVALFVNGTAMKMLVSYHLVNGVIVDYMDRFPRSFIENWKLYVTEEYSLREFSKDAVSEVVENNIAKMLSLQYPEPERRNIYKPKDKDTETLEIPKSVEVPYSDLLNKYSPDEIWDMASGKKTDVTEKEIELAKDVISRGIVAKVFRGLRGFKVIRRQKIGIEELEPRVSKEELIRLYTQEAKGIYDEELMDEIISKFIETLEKIGQWEKETEKEMHDLDFKIAPYSQKTLSLIPILENAKTPQEKMMAIDKVIHEAHQYDVYAQHLIIDYFGEDNFLNELGNLKVSSLNMRKKALDPLTQRELLLTGILFPTPEFIEKLNLKKEKDKEEQKDKYKAFEKPFEEKYEKGLKSTIRKNIEEQFIIPQQLKLQFEKTAGEEKEEEWWPAPLVTQQELKRLYLQEAKGVYNEELMDEIISKFIETLEELFKHIAWLVKKMPDISTLPSAAYYDLSLQLQNAKTPQEKMIAIDKVINTEHTSGLVGSYLIKDVGYDKSFFDELSNLKVSSKLCFKKISRFAQVDSTYLGTCRNLANNFFNDATEMAQLIEDEDSKEISLKEIWFYISEDLKKKISKRPNDFSAGQNKNILWVYDDDKDIHYFFALSGDVFEKFAQVEFNVGDEILFDATRYFGVKRKGPGGVLKGKGIIKKKNLDNTYDVKITEIIDVARGMEQIFKPHIVVPFLPEEMKVTKKEEVKEAPKVEKLVEKPKVKEPTKVEKPEMEEKPKEKPLVFELDIEPEEEIPTPVEEFGEPEEKEKERPKFWKEVWKSFQRPVTRPFGSLNLKSDIQKDIPLEEVPESKDIDIVNLDYSKFGICAWCKGVFDRSTMQVIKHLTNEEYSKYFPYISHGICDECKKEVLKKESRLVFANEEPPDPAPPLVTQQELIRLYTQEAKGIYDEELMDEIISKFLETIKGLQEWDKWYEDVEYIPLDINLVQILQSAKTPQGKMIAIDRVINTAHRIGHFIKYLVIDSDDDFLNGLGNLKISHLTFRKVMANKLEEEDLLADYSVEGIEKFLKEEGIKDPNIEFSELDPNLIDPSEWNELGADPKKVQEIVQTYKEGTPIKPVVVTPDKGRYKVIDGIHRTEAAKVLHTLIPAYIIPDSIYELISNWGDTNMSEWAEKVYRFSKLSMRKIAQGGDIQNKIHSREEIRGLLKVLFWKYGKRELELVLRDRHFIEQEEGLPIEEDELIEDMIQEKIEGIVDIILEEEKSNSFPKDQSVELFINGLVEDAVIYWVMDLVKHHPFIYTGGLGRAEKAYKLFTGTKVFSKKKERIFFKNIDKAKNEEEINQIKKEMNTALDFGQLTEDEASIIEFAISQKMKEFKTSLGMRKTATIDVNDLKKVYGLEPIYRELEQKYNLGTTSEKESIQYNNIEKSLDIVTDKVVLDLIEFIKGEIEWIDRRPVSLPDLEKVYADLMNSSEALESAFDINSKMIAIDNTINVMHIDFPLILHMQWDQEENISDIKVAERLENDWDNLIDFLESQGKLKIPRAKIQLNMRKKAQNKLTAEDLYYYYKLEKNGLLTDEVVNNVISKLLYGLEELKGKREDSTSVFLIDKNIKSLEKAYLELLENKIIAVEKIISIYHSGGMPELMSGDPQELGKALTNFFWGKKASTVSEPIPDNPLDEIQGEHEFWHTYQQGDDRWEDREADQGYNIPFPSLERIERSPWLWEDNPASQMTASKLNMRKMSQTSKDLEFGIIKRVNLTPTEKEFVESFVKQYERLNDAGEIYEELDRSVFIFELILHLEDDLGISKDRSEDVAWAIRNQLLVDLSYFTLTPAPVVGSLKFAYTGKHGMWAIYKGKIYTIESDEEEHIEWFDQIGLPTFGLEYDKIVRGTYAPEGIITYSDTGTFEEFSDNLPKLLRRLRLPEDAEIGIDRFIPEKLSMRKVTYTKNYGNWVIYKGNIYIDTTGSKIHTDWLEEIGLPSAGLEYDAMPRGVYSPFWIMWYSNTGTFEEFSDNLPKLIKTLDLPLDVEIRKIDEKIAFDIEGNLESEAAYIGENEGLWAIYEGKIYFDPTPTKVHVHWFEDIGLPISGRAFDLITRGVYSAREPRYLQWYEGTGSFEEFSDNLPKLIERLGLPQNVKVDAGKGYTMQLKNEIISSYKGPVKSILENISQDVWQATDLETAKQIILNRVEPSQIDEEDKRKIIYNVEKIDNLKELQKYLANSILFYSGMGTKLSSTNSEAPFGSVEYYDYVERRLEQLERISAKKGLTEKQIKEYDRLVLEKEKMEGTKLSFRKKVYTEDINKSRRFYTFPRTKELNGKVTDYGMITITPSTKEHGKIQFTFFSRKSPNSLWEVDGDTQFNTWEEADEYLKTLEKDFILFYPPTPSVLSFRKTSQINKQLFFDFYGVSLLSDQYLEVNLYAKEYKDMIVNQVKEIYVPLITKMVYEELEENFDMWVGVEYDPSGATITEAFEPFLEKKFNVRKIKDLTLEQLRQIYNEEEWEEEFGGKSWGHIVESLIQLKNTTDTNQLITIIDHINDIEHNTGLMFHDFPEVAKWFADALEIKAQATPEQLMPYLSKDVRNLVIEDLKLRGEETREEPKKFLTKENKEELARFSTDPKVLIELARDKNVDVLYYLSLNTATPSEILEMLSKNKNEDIRWAINKNPNTPSKIKKELKKEFGSLNFKKIAIDKFQKGQIIKLKKNQEVFEYIWDQVKEYDKTFTINDLDDFWNIDDISEDPLMLNIATLEEGKFCSWIEPEMVEKIILKLGMKKFTTYTHGLWAIYKGKVYFEPGFEDHEVWFEKIGLPMGGKEFDTVPRGVYDSYSILWYEDTGTFEEFSDNLLELIKTLGLPENTKIETTEYLMKEAFLSFRKSSVPNPILQSLDYPHSWPQKKVLEEKDKKEATISDSEIPEDSQVIDKTDKKLRRTNPPRHDKNDSIVEHNLDPRIDMASLKFQNIQDFGMWAIYEGKVYTLPNVRIGHSQWFEEIGLPTSGKEFDKVVRGIYANGEIVWFEHSGTFEEFSNYLLELEQKIGYPPLSPIRKLYLPYYVERINLASLSLKKKAQNKLTVQDLFRFYKLEQKGSLTSRFVDNFISKFIYGMQEYVEWIRNKEYKKEKDLKGLSEESWNEDIEEVTQDINTLENAYTLPLNEKIIAVDQLINAWHSKGMSTFVEGGDEKEVNEALHKLFYSNASKSLNLRKKAIYEEKPLEPEPTVEKSDLRRLYKQEAKGLYDVPLMDEIISSFITVLNEWIEWDEWAVREENYGEILEEQIKVEKYLVEILQSAKTPQQKMIAIDQVIHKVHESGVYGDYLIRNFDVSFFDELGNLKISKKLNFRQKESFYGQPSDKNYNSPSTLEREDQGPYNPTEPASSQVMDVTEDQWGESNLLKKKKPIKEQVFPEFNTSYGWPGGEDKQI